MRLFPSFFLAAVCAGSLAACSPKLVPLTSDTASAALPAGTPYALLHFYRPGKMTGFLIGYDAHVGDSVGYRARNGSRGNVRRRVPGPVAVWPKTEAREELVLDVLPGREYYVRCTLGMGALVGRPCPACSRSAWRRGARKAGGSPGQPRNPRAPQKRRQRHSRHPHPSKRTAEGDFLGATRRAPPVWARNRPPGAAAGGAFSGPAGFNRGFNAA